MSTDEPRALVTLREALESLGWATCTRRYPDVWLLDNVPNMTVCLVAILGDEKIVAGWVCEVRSTLDLTRLSRWRRCLLEAGTVVQARWPWSTWAPLPFGAGESSTLDSVPAAIRHAQLVTATARTLAKLDERS